MLKTMIEWRYILDTPARPIRFVPSILAVPLPPLSSHNLFVRYNTFSPSSARACVWIRRVREFGVSFRAFACGFSSRATTLDVGDCCRGEGARVQREGESIKRDWWMSRSRARPDCFRARLRLPVTINGH